MPYKHGVTGSSPVGSTKNVGFFRHFSLRRLRELPRDMIAYSESFCERTFAVAAYKGGVLKGIACFREVISDAPLAY